MAKASGNKRLAQPGTNCWSIEHANRAALVVDAADYFQRLEQMMRMAQRRLLFVGWDFDTRIKLSPQQPGALTLGQLALDLAKANPRLEIGVLRWNVGAIRSIFRGRMMIDLARWRMTPGIKLRFDSQHPAGCTQHQKIVIIDDCLAVCGGIDATSGRWDERGHPSDDPRRTGPDGKRYMPWHDATMIVDGDAAKRLSELARERWLIATGEELTALEPMEPCWPEGLESDFENIDIAVARTRAEWKQLSEIREIERLTIDMICTSKRHVYIENQYFTSPAIAAAIADRLDDDDPPEIVMVVPLEAEGKLEQWAMDGARARLIQELQKGANGDRFRVYYPTTGDGEEIYVHSKLTIIDDTMIRVGSANLNNRSMGLDTECDQMIEALGSKAVSERITAIRNDLIAEHLGVEPDEVAATIADKGSLISAIEALWKPDGHTLRPLPLRIPKGLESFIADNQILDPEDAAQFFEPFSKRGLLMLRFRNFSGRMRKARPTLRGLGQRLRNYSGRKSGTDK